MALNFVLPHSATGSGQSLVLFESPGLPAHPSFFDVRLLLLDEPAGSLIFLDRAADLEGRGSFEAVGESILQVIS